MSLNVLVLMERISDGQSSPAEVSTSGLFQRLRHNTELRQWFEGSWLCSCSGPRNAPQSSLGFMFSKRSEHGNPSVQEKIEINSSTFDMSLEEEGEEVYSRRKCLGLIMKASLKG